MKETYSSANKVKSGVPQGSLLGVILFNIQFNDIFDIIDEAELYNYTDDNNLSAVGNSTIEAKNILKQQTPGGTPLSDSWGGPVRVKSAHFFLSGKHLKW